MTTKIQSALLTYTTGGMSMLYRRPTLLIALVALIGVTGRSGAQQTDPVADLNKAQGELSVCAAYFTAVHVCLHGQDPALSAKVREMITHTGQLAETIGNAIGLTADAMQSRQQLALEEMAKLTQSNCFNMSSLILRHAENCKTYAEYAATVFRKYSPLQ